jgi:hypothetical protein
VRERSSADFRFAVSAGVPSSAALAATTCAAKKPMAVVLAGTLDELPLRSSRPARGAQANRGAPAPEPRGRRRPAPRDAQRRSHDRRSGDQRGQLKAAVWRPIGAAPRGRRRAIMPCDRTALSRPGGGISLTPGQRNAICWLRCNNGKEVIQCLTSWWRVWLRRTRLWSRPPGSVDGAETSNHHEIRVRPPYVPFRAPRFRTRRFSLSDGHLAGRSSGGGNEENGATGARSSVRAAYRAGEVSADHLTGHP